MKLITMDSMFDDRRKARDTLAARGSIFAAEGHCGDDTLPCGVCDDCIEAGVLDVGEGARVASADDAGYIDSIHATGPAMAVPYAIVRWDSGVTGPVALAEIEYE